MIPKLVNNYKDEVVSRSDCADRGTGLLHSCSLIWHLHVSTAHSSRKELLDAHLNTPIFNSVLAYFLMMLFFLSPKSRNTPNSKWTYFISSIFDVVALNTSIQAFQRTLIASVTMITVLSVITTTIMSIIWFKMRYFWTHYLAILFCIGGVFLTLYSDFFTPDGFDFGSFWGDILAVISALCYGVTSVISEYLVRSGSNNIAILAHLGFFGFVFALIASFAFTEFRELSHFQEQTDPHYADLWWYAAYAFAGAGIYFFAQLTIYLSSATIFHLIGLTSTLWGMLGDVLVFDKDFVRSENIRNCCTFWDMP